MDNRPRFAIMCMNCSQEGDLRVKKKHPNKHIQAAIEYALSKGWNFIEVGRSGHAFCILRCGDSNPNHSGHTMSVWSTPGNSENFAKQIRRKVDKCKK